MKSKEEIYCSNGGSYIRSKQSEGHLKAMQEYADQQLQEYKAKLMEEINLYDSTGMPLIKNVLYSIIENI